MASTIYDIAEKAGVSIATVSRVFNRRESVSERTRKKVMAIAEEVGYHPQANAQGLASRKTNNITVVVPVISNYFFMEVLGGIQDKLNSFDYELTIFNISPSKDTFSQVEHVLKRRASEGCLFISIHLEQEEWHQLKRYNIPITLIDEYYEGFDSVSVDNTEGAYKATKYLLNSGLDRVAMLSALITSKPIQSRIKGFRRAYEETGKAFSPSLIVAGDSTYRDGFTERGGYEAMVKILTMKPEVEACFCASDIQAFGALKAMQDMNKSIPLIGYDDIELAEYMGLSTIRQPMRDMGFFATQNLIDRLENPKKAVSQTVYTPELILRDSTE
ncbi:LacI family transcriptional regulator [bacterium]|nr:LacI family DNA-binding transcriptional regulator [Balneola sp.]MBR9916772.1 LacI family transcriptional regulator [bacterium]